MLGLLTCCSCVMSSLMVTLTLSPGKYYHHLTPGNKAGVMRVMNGQTPALRKRREMMFISLPAVWCKYSTRIMEAIKKLFMKNPTLNSKPHTYVQNIVFV